jgi:hypothetical protein
MLSELPIVTGWWTDKLVPRLTAVAIVCRYVFGSLDLGSSYHFWWGDFIVVEDLHLPRLGSNTPCSLIGLLINHAFAYVWVVVLQGLSWACMRNLRCIRSLVCAGGVKILNSSCSSVRMLWLLKTRSLERVLLSWRRMGPVAVTAVH